ncbi:type II secretion system protein N [Lampropedia puyangensis]|uniref:Type II secretion system protein N n=2 Tax=Lampropedia puyangensis TaxID=1330072 RepID=A0A4S8FBD4_9BURK|nr:type II secretion system protein N [Lampropedia puyangensis]
MGRWALLGALVGLLAATLWFAPAQWLAAGLTYASQGRIQLQATQGSIWTGSALVNLTGGTNSRDQMALPGRMHWRIRPAWLGVDVGLQPDCCASNAAQVHIRGGWQRVDITVNQHQSLWPSSVLQGLGAPWNTLQLDGELMLKFDQYHLQWVQGRTLMQGTIEAALHHASSRLTTIRPMGSYRLIMQGGDTVELKLLTDQGPLQLSGQGQWQGQHLRFTGEASAAPEHLPALSNLLSLLGRRQGDRAILSF